MILPSTQAVDLATALLFAPDRRKELIDDSWSMKSIWLIAGSWDEYSLSRNVSREAFRRDGEIRNMRCGIETGRAYD